MTLSVEVGRRNPVLDEDGYAGHLTRFMGYCTENGAVVVMVASPPLGGAELRMPTGARVRDATLGRYADIMRTVALAGRGLFVDTRAIFGSAVGGKKDLLSEVDGSHPNVRGHALLHKHISAALIELGAL